MTVLGYFLVEELRFRRLAQKCQVSEANFSLRPLRLCENAPAFYVFTIAGRRLCQSVAPWNTAAAFNTV
jgi:hypothetical protein